MRTAGNRRRRSRAPAGGAAAFAGNDDGEEQHLNPFLDAAPSASSRVQFRNVASRARWVEEAGVAEVVESKGKLWLTTGVTRGAKLCYNVEEIGDFLFEYLSFLVKACLLSDETMQGCSWDAFQAYKHLKLLGYIVGRYGVPWTIKNSGSCDIIVPPTSVVHNDKSFNRFDDTCSDITKLLKEMHIDGISPSFQVYLPNSKFKKIIPRGNVPFIQPTTVSSSNSSSSIGLPVFLNKPPSRVELETVEYNFGGIPLKYCHVDNGRASFVSLDKVALPSLP
uniref:tRNA-splicing endonuclease subunit Sen54 N-terminal domain-containing protein n=1 Tax=Setaria italica TaxID=4555 RepID=K3Y374_SETIT